MQSPDKPANVSVVRVIFLTSVVVLLVIAAMLNDAHRRAGPILAKAMIDMGKVKEALYLFAWFEYATFSSLPTNTVLRTSPDFVVKWQQVDILRPLRDYFTGRRMFTTNGGLVDPYGNYFNFIINTGASTEPNHATFPVRLWSNGPNGKDENGKGDDILYKFDIILDLSNLPSE